MRGLIFEFKLLWRSVMARWLLLAYIVITLLAAGFGSQRLHQEEVARQQVQAHFNEQLRHWQARGEDVSPGYMAYYLKVPAAFSPSPWVGLVRGERDERPTQLRVGLLAVQGQIYEGELTNHSLLPLGVLDAAFVWIYLLPLLVGVLCVNCLAGERESGRWPMLASQVSAARLLCGRLGVHFALLLLLSMLLFVVASAISGVAFDGLWLKVLGLLCIYQLFWYAVVTAIVVMQLGSLKNTLAYVGIWLTLGFLVPGMAYLSQMEPQDLNNDIGLMVKQRQTMNDSWDRDKAADLQAFLQSYPEWSDTSPMEGRFDWKWYYAMQQQSDAVVAELAGNYRQRRVQLADEVQVWRWWSPMLNLQFALRAVAQTDAAAHQGYLDQLVSWHNEMRAFWYPYFFLDKPFEVGATSDLPAFDYQHPVSAGIAKTIQQISLLIVLLVVCTGLVPARRRMVPVRSRPLA